MTPQKIANKIKAGIAKNKLNYLDSEILAYRKLVRDNKDIDIDLTKYFGVKKLIHISIKNHIFFGDYMNKSTYVVTKVSKDEISLIDIHIPEFKETLSKREFCKRFYIQDSF
jgi:hypothetical protein